MNCIVLPIGSRPSLSSCSRVSACLISSVMHFFKNSGTSLPCPRDLRMEQQPLTQPEPRPGGQGTRSAAVHPSADERLSVEERVHAFPKPLIVFEPAVVLSNLPPALPSCRNPSGGVSSTALPGHNTRSRKMLHILSFYVAESSSFHEYYRISQKTVFQFYCFFTELFIRYSLCLVAAALRRPPCQRFPFCSPMKWITFQKE
jgi:hypothetical protein